jgi:hypothetical protein
MKSMLYVPSRSKKCRNEPTAMLELVFKPRLGAQGANLPLVLLCVRSAQLLKSALETASKPRRAVTRGELSKTLQLISIYMRRPRFLRC